MHLHLRIEKINNKDKDRQTCSLYNKMQIPINKVHSRKIVSPTDHKNQTTLTILNLVQVIVIIDSLTLCNLLN